MLMNQSVSIQPLYCSLGEYFPLPDLQAFPCSEYTFIGYFHFPAAKMSDLWGRLKRLHLYKYLNQSYPLAE